LTWFEDTNRHKIESKNSIHRLIYCQLCQKLVSKSDCQKLRQDKYGNLYKIKRYHYDKVSKVKREEHKEEKEAKRLQELATLELSKIAKHFI
jgi:hypothetical protein